MKLPLIAFVTLLVFGSPASGVAAGRRPGGGGGTPACPVNRLAFTPATAADLQTALDCADPGAIITLNAGEANAYRGNFTLRHKTVAYESDGTTPKRIRILSAALSSLPSDTRVTPQQEPSLAWLIVPAGSTAPVLVTELRDIGTSGRLAASHYRLEGIKFVTDHWVNQLVRLGTTTETLASELPVDITFDRSYFAGAATEGTRQGLVANANAVTVTNSHFSDFKDTAADAQAIVVWNGAGPFWIENNHLEGSGENVMFGGGDPSIDGLVPSDVTVLRNHFVKPLSWTTDRSTRKGSSFRKKWRIKNLFELKNAQRVLVEGNVFENNWIQADQHGFAIVLTPRNQDGTAPWSTVQQVIFRYNVIANSTAGFNLMATDDTNPSQPLAHVLIEHNVLMNINGQAVQPSDPGSRPGRLFQILNPVPTSLPIDLTVRRNTAFSTREITFSAWNPTSALVFTDNVVRHNRCLEGNDCGVSGDGTAVPGNLALSEWFDDPIDVSGNVLFDAGRDRTADYPAGNTFPDTVTFLSDCQAGSPTIDQVTGEPTGSSAPHYTAVNGRCQALGVGVDWNLVRPLIERARSGQP